MIVNQVPVFLLKSFAIFLVTKNTPSQPYKSRADFFHAFLTGQVINFNPCTEKTA